MKAGKSSVARIGSSSPRCSELPQPRRDDKNRAIAVLVERGAIAIEFVLRVSSRQEIRGLLKTTNQVEFLMELSRLAIQNSDSEPLALPGRTMGERRRIELARGLACFVDTDNITSKLMAKPSTTAADIDSLKKLRSGVQRLMLEERWNLQIAKEFYEIRKQSGLSIRLLSQRARVPASTIQRLEDADPRWVSLPQLLRVVHAVGGKLTIVRPVPRWFALFHEGRILQETFALDADDAFMKFRELRGKLPSGATIERSTGKNKLEK